MALIKCPECGKEISDKAIACPNCGNPMNQQAQQEEYLCCPKCGSRELHAEHKGFSGGKALAGALVTGGIGLLAGTIGSRDTQITCLKCGNKFKAGEAVVKRPGGDSVSEDEAMVLSFLPAKLQAVKWYKERHNCSLSEAKDSVDAIAAKHNSELAYGNTSGSGCSIIVLIGISITLGAMLML
jgi:DNA-directed RNA polymerase subunit RPC12/RpoP